MNSKSIYEFNGYKDYLKFRIAEEQSKWGLMTRLAAAAGCLRPYISRVLSTESHLTPAQAFGLARYWNLNEDESEYFIGLLEIERAGSAPYREHLEQKISKAKKRNESLTHIVNRKAATTDERDLTYYSAWYWTAIHILVSIPDFRTDKSIAERLGLPATQVASILAELESWGAVEQIGSKWKFRQREQHISRDSPLSVFHHSNWRQRAMLSAQRGLPENVHFTVVQSLSAADFARIKQMILNLIKNVADIAGPSREEKLMCFNCDFFEP